MHPSHTDMFWVSRPIMCPNLSFPLLTSFSVTNTAPRQPCLKTDTLLTWQNCHCIRANCPWTGCSTGVPPHLGYVHTAGKSGFLLICDSDLGFFSITVWTTQTTWILIFLLYCSFVHAAYSRQEPVHTGIWYGPHIKICSVNEGLHPLSFLCWWSTNTLCFMVPGSKT